MFTRFHRSAVPDEAILAFYRALIDSGRERASYASTPAQNAEEYVRMVRENGNPWWLITRGEHLAGCFYLTDLEGKCARCHFAFLPAPPGVTPMGGGQFPLAMGRYILASALHDRGQDGEYIMNTLVGVTPANNPGALSLAKKCGAVVLGTIPGGYYIHDEDKNEDAVVSCCTRETVPLKWAEGDYGQW